MKDFINQIITNSLGMLKLRGTIDQEEVDNIQEWVNKRYTLEDQVITLSEFIQYLAYIFENSTSEFCTHHDDLESALEKIMIGALDVEIIAQQIAAEHAAADGMKKDDEFDSYKCRLIKQGGEVYINVDDLQSSIYESFICEADQLQDGEFISTKEEFAQLYLDIADSIVNSLEESKAAL